MKVILLMALTIDGKIGRDSFHFPDWTPAEDKQLFKELSMAAGVVIMGSKTFDTIGRPLPNRKNIVLTRSTDRRSQFDNLIFTGQTPGEILADLQSQGFREAVLAGGARVNYLFARDNLVDEIIVTFSPRIFGAGLDMFSDPLSMDLALVSVDRLGRDLIQARYQVLKSS